MREHKTPAELCGARRSRTGQKHRDPGLIRKGSAHLKMAGQEADAEAVGAPVPILIDPPSRYHPTEVW